jgi:hypothetical protein
MLVASKASVGRPSISSVYVRKDGRVDDFPGSCRRNKSLQSFPEVHLRLKFALSFVAPRMIVNWGSGSRPPCGDCENNARKSWIERAKRKHSRHAPGGTRMNLCQLLFSSLLKELNQSYRVLVIAIKIIIRLNDMG